MLVCSKKIEKFISYLENLSSDTTFEKNDLPYSITVITGLYTKVLEEMLPKINAANVSKEYYPTISQIVFAKLLNKNLAQLENLKLKLDNLGVIASRAIDVDSNTITDEDSDRLIHENIAISACINIIDTALLAIINPQQLYISSNDEDESNPIVFKTTENILSKNDYAGFNQNEIRYYANMEIEKLSKQELNPNKIQDYIKLVERQVTIAQQVQRTLKEYGEPRYSLNFQNTKHLESAIMISDLNKICEKYKRTMHKAIYNSINNNDRAIMDAFIATNEQNEQNVSSNNLQENLITFLQEQFAEEIPLKNDLSQKSSEKLKVKIAEREKPLSAKTSELLNNLNYIAQDLQPILLAKGDPTNKVESFKDKLLAIKQDMKIGITKENIFQKFLIAIARCFNIQPIINEAAKKAFYRDLESTLFSQDKAKVTSTYKSDKSVTHPRKE